MAITRREQHALLCDYVNSLASQMAITGHSVLYLKYLRDVNAGTVRPEVVDREDWELLPPADKSLKLLHHYHTIRSELQVLSQENGEVNSASLSEWLESSWVPVPMTSAALLKTAQILFDQATNTGFSFAVDIAKPN